MAVADLVDEELAPGRSAINVQTLVTLHLQLGPEEMARVGVDQQQRLAVRRNLWGDGDAVGPLPFDPRAERGGNRPVRIERLELIEIDALDIAADAALGEAHDHPRLEVRQRA